MQRPSGKIIVLAAGAALIVGGIGAHALFSAGKGAQAKNTSAAASSPKEQAARNTDTLAHTQRKNRATSSSPTLTEQFGQEFLSSYLSLGAGERELSAEEKQELVRQLVENVSLEAVEPAYTTDDLSLVAPTAENRRAYGNRFMEMLAQHEGATAAEVYTVIDGATTNAGDVDAAKLGPLADVAARYRALADDLRALSVPDDVSETHLGIINGFAATAQIVAELGHLAEDPLAGLLNIRRFQLRLNNTTELFTKTKKYFQQNAILFTTGEPGRAWNNF